VKKLTATGCTAILLTLSTAAGADAYRTYDASIAKQYATLNYNTAYGTGSGQNPFTNYINAVGGNCTNFASQTIMAALSGQTVPATVFGVRTNYDIDKTAPFLKWYFISDADRGPAFTGAHELWYYATNNTSQYKGLHFQYVTNSTPTDPLNVAAVQVGDIIFADWERDGHKDHTMIVTAKCGATCFGYNKIKVTYQGSQFGLGIKDNGLGNVLNTAPNALFHVWRPIDYNPNGL
jgi:Putative amidase domain